MIARAALRTLALSVTGVALTPAVAAARPAGPPGDSRMASALFTGIGDPICTVAGLLVLAVVAMSVWSRERNWRIGAMVLGALSIGLGLALARIGDGHSATTVIGIAAGVIGLLTPALHAGLDLDPAQG